MLAPWSEYEHHEPDVLALMVGALSQWAAFAQRLDLPPTARPRPGGTLHVALTREDEHRLADRVERLSALGPEADLRVLDAEACREREPALNDRVCAGVLLPCEASIDNRELLRVLGERADEGGVERADDWIDPLGTRTPSDVVVWATGAFDPAPRLAVRPVQGISVRVRAPGVVRHVVRAEIDRRTCYLVPRDSGEIVIGASSADIGPDVSARLGTVADLMADAVTIVPALRDAVVSGIDVGLRPTAPDGLPFVAPRPGRPRELVVGGLARHGFLLAPWIERAVEQALTKLPGPPLRPHSREDDA